MESVLGSLVALAGLGLVVGALTGRVKLKPCCPSVDPACEAEVPSESENVRRA
jgi:hypothetical protein